MSDKSVLQDWNARCHSCGRDSIVALDVGIGRFAEIACPHCGQATGFDGLGPKGGSMSTDILGGKKAGKQPEPDPADPEQGLEDNKPSPIARLIGGKKK
jgi:predicted RNA-binding Zn-ribbon protein involved in translation (DUF1610 family)